MRDNIKQQTNYSNPNLLQWPAGAGKQNTSRTPTGIFDEFSSAAEWSCAEQRNLERSPLSIKLFFNGTEATGVASKRDISGSGLYMTTGAELSEGARLTLVIPFGNEQIMIRGSIVYSNPGRGVGVHFDRPSAKERDALRALARQ
jgi:PilZ domain